MESTDDSPQLGSIDIDRAALGVGGTTLAALLAELGASVDEATLLGAPSEGWRIVRRHESGTLLGAPEDSSGVTWRVAQIPSDGPARVHPGSLPLRKSRAERRAGLELEWPSLGLETYAGGIFAVDIRNTGKGVWVSDGDNFHAFGALTLPEVADYYLGWATVASERAVPLGPGEYARVPVTIDQSSWRDLQPGDYDLHAVVPSLGLRTARPLRVALSAETIALHNRPPRRAPNG